MNYIEHSQLLATLVAELVKRGVVFTVRPLDGLVEVTATYAIDNMNSGSEICHPYVVEDDDVEHSIRLVRDNEECEDGVEYKWVFAGQEWPALP